MFIFIQKKNWKLKKKKETLDVHFRPYLKKRVPYYRWMTQRLAFFFFLQIGFITFFGYPRRSIRKEKIAKRESGWVKGYDFYAPTRSPLTRALCFATLWVNWTCPLLSNDASLLGTPNAILFGSKQSLVYRARLLKS